MASKWIKKGDKVLIIAGNDKGKIGEVLARKEDRVVIQGVNLRKKHLRQKERKAEIATIELPVHISNVSLCTSDGDAIQLKMRLTEKGKELYYTKDGKEVSYRMLKKFKK